MTDDQDRLLREMVAAYAMHQPAGVTDDAKIGDDLGMDNLELLDVAMQVEDAFRIAFADADLDGIETFGDLRKVVAGKLAVPA